jgi:F-type H+-transporting ATPase subunit b
MNDFWFTFAAQIVNFLVLVALLRWLLYGRIVRAMHDRKAKIQNRLEEAEQWRREAEMTAHEHEEKVREIEQRREQMLESARGQAQEEGERWRREAREEVGRKRQQWEESFRRERRELLSEVRRQAGHAGVEAARRTLEQLADVDLESRICDRFAERLRELDGQQRDEIARHLGDGEDVVSIRSAFNVSQERRKRLRETLRETIGYNAAIEFEQASDLICGLELDVGGYRFGWNVKQFLHDLELEFDDKMEAES